MTWDAFDTYLDDEPTVFRHPPMLLLHLATLSLVIAIVCIFLHSVALSWFAYVLSSIVPVLLIAGFRHLDRRTRLEPHYAPNLRVRPYQMFLMVLIFVMSVASAASVAIELARG